MKNKNYIIIGVITFAVGLVLGVLNPFQSEPTSESKQVKSYKQALNEKQKDYDALQEKYDLLEEQKTPKKDSGGTTKVDTTTARKFFETLLAYNQSQYHSRFKEALKYGTESATYAFNPEGTETNMPSEEVEGYVSKWDYYQSNNNPLEGIVMVTYGMRTGAGDNQVTAEFNVTLDPNGKVKSLEKKRFEQNIGDEDDN